LNMEKNNSKDMSSTSEQKPCIDKKNENDKVNEIKQENPELQEMKETLQRLQAEFENYQKRAQKESENFRVLANASLIKDLLPVLDTLEQGINHNKELLGVKNQLESILKKNGLLKIVVEKGDLFDHEKMDCLMEEKCDDVETGKVVNILINGYTLNGLVLRPTKVSIASENKNNDDLIMEQNKK